MSSSMQIIPTPFSLSLLPGQRCLCEAALPRVPSVMVWPGMPPRAGLVPAALGALCQPCSGEAVRFVAWSLVL